MVKAAVPDISYVTGKELEFQRVGTLSSTSIV